MTGVQTCALPIFHAAQDIRAPGEVDAPAGLADDEALRGRMGLDHARPGAGFPAPVWGSADHDDDAEKRRRRRRRREELLPGVDEPEVDDPEVDDFEVERPDVELPDVDEPRPELEPPPELEPLPLLPEPFEAWALVMVRMAGVT